MLMGASTKLVLHQFSFEQLEQSTSHLLVVPPALKMELFTLRLIRKQNPLHQISTVHITKPQCFSSPHSVHAKPKGNLLLMNRTKTNESHFRLWYKQLVISHEDGIIVDLI